MILQPLIFKPIFKELLWGGRRMARSLHKKLPEDKCIGESWELSGVPGDVSVVAEGPLKGNNLEELIEVYMGDLVGDPVYNRFGQLFPLLVKLIDAQDDLSIQVHPDDALARERHNSYGKTEMWHVLECEPGAALYVGFNREVSREEYLRHAGAGTLPELLNRVEVAPGDTFFIPAGTIHAIGRGILIAEIQETSDITYRVFDWNRVDAWGKGRELHTDLALGAIDFTAGGRFDVTRPSQPNRAVPLVESPFFTTNLLQVSGSCLRDHSDKESFVIYLVTEGSLTMAWNGGSRTILRGETLLVPASLDEITLTGEGKLLEVYMD